MIERILAFLRGQRQDALKSPPSEYRQGFINCVDETEEFIENEAWEAGIDYEEDDYEQTGY